MSGDNTLKAVRWRFIDVTRNGSITRKKLPLRCGLLRMVYYS